MTRQSDARRMAEQAQLELRAQQVRGDEVEADTRARLRREARGQQASVIHENAGPNRHDMRRPYKPEEYAAMLAAQGLSVPQISHVMRAKAHQRKGRAKRGKK